MISPSDRALLVELLRLAEKATPGPWLHTRYRHGPGFAHVINIEQENTEIIRCMKWPWGKETDAEQNADFVAAARNAMPALSRLLAQEGDGWKPIETAPMDGTVIDLWDADWKCRLTDCAWKHHHWFEGRPQGGKDWRPGDRDGPPYSRLTHWMPLPAAPDAEGGTR